MPNKTQEFIATWHDPEHGNITATRVSTSAYTHAAVIGFRDGGPPVIWSFHTSKELARKGTLTKAQRESGFYVCAVAEVTVNPLYGVTNAMKDVLLRALNDGGNVLTGAAGTLRALHRRNWVTRFQDTDGTRWSLSLEGKRIATLIREELTPTLHALLWPNKGAPNTLGVLRREGLIDEKNQITELGKQRRNEEMAKNNF